MEFREAQRFRQPWLWIILLAAVTLVIGLFAWGMYAQLIQNNPWGDQPLSDPWLFFIGTGSILLSLLFIWFFFAMKLTTQVNQDGIRVRFFPILDREITYTEIESCEATRYRPLRDYGGWGIRYRFGGKGMLLAVGGSMAVRLQFKNSTPLLIGTQKPGELADAINSHLSSLRRHRTQ